MSQLPIKPAKLDRVIRAVAAVRTRGGFAAWNLLLMAITFSSLLLLDNNVSTNQMWLIMAFFVGWQTFAVFALLKLPMNDKRKPQPKPGNNRD